MLKWFEPMALGDFLKLERVEKRRRLMVLTFDDGLAECHQVIAPLLKQKGIPAAFFLNNYFIDNKNLFYRFKASLLIDQILTDCRAKERSAAYLAIPEERVTEAILMVSYEQQPLLDALAKEVDVDFEKYMQKTPVYMNTHQVQELVSWGFEIGGHSIDHADFQPLDHEEMIAQVKGSVDDIQQKYQVPTRYFSFPFTSSGVPRKVIDTLLNEQIASVLLGTSGLKRTGKPGFIQRIPMEEYEASALEAVKAEYIYYLIKKPFGRNTLRY
jgi:peptidoglycan/xylan/chitin deacetylase (PgdA/CDA1 family)